MMRRILVIVFTLFGVVPAVVGAQQPPTGVIATAVQRESFADELEALGTLRASEKVDLTATVTELVTAVNFEDGQRVNKGDVLVEMNAEEEDAQFAEEKYNLEEANRQIKRLAPLAAQGAASQSALDEAQRTADTAKARMAAIRSRIEQRRIVAPFDGVMGLRNISVGALAQPGTLIGTIDDDRFMKLDFSVPAVFLRSLEPGVTIEATTRAFPGRPFIGVVDSVDSRIDPITRSIIVRAIIDNEDRTLKPGLLMRVVLKKDVRESIVIPEEALTPEGERNYVFRVLKKGDDMIAEKQYVEIGSRKKGKVEVIVGLDEGQIIITHGGIKMRPGAVVDVKAIEKGGEPLSELIAPAAQKPAEEPEQAETQEGAE